MEKPITSIDDLNNSAYQSKFSDLNKAVALARQAQDILRRFATPYQKGWFDSEIILAWEQYFATDFIQSFSVAKQALAWYRDAEDQIGEMWALYLMGVSSNRMGNYEIATKCHLKQLEIAIPLGDVSDIAEAHNIVGLICNNVKEYEQAKKHLDIANELFKSLNDDTGQILTHSNLIYQAMLLEDHHMAISIGEAARNIYNRSSSTSSNRFIGNILQYLGRAYAALGDYDKAMGCFNEAIDICETGNYMIDKVLSRVHLGECYKWQEKYDDAIEIFLQALSFMDKIPMSYAANKCHRMLAEIYETQGNIHLAYKHLKLFNQLQEKALSENGRHQLQYHKLFATIEQVRFRNQLLQQQRENDRAYFDTLSKLRNEVISTAQHDLNNPLTAILLNIHKLRRYGQTSEVIWQKSLQRLEDSAETMRDMIANLLDIAQLETGRSLQIDRVSLSAFVDDSIRLMTVLAEEKDIRLKSNIQSQFKNVHFDKFRIRQVVDNLISNAIKYSGNGEQITLQVEDDDKHLIFHVKDTGFGIPKKNLPKLFERFYRVDEGQHSSVSGTGLGLSIVKTIVNQHGGTIWVTSEESVGSTFSFTIPLNLGHIDISTQSEQNLDEIKNSA